MSTMVGRFGGVLFATTLALLGAWVSGAALAHTPEKVYAAAGNGSYGYSGNNFSLATQLTAYNGATANGEGNPAVLGADGMAIAYVVGLQLPVIPTVLHLSCPSLLNAGASGSCSATATLSDASSIPVTATWSSSNPTVLSVSSGGGLTAGTPSADTSVTITGSYRDVGVSLTATAAVTVKGAIPTLTSLSISGSTTVTTGSTAQFSSSASYSDNSSKGVVPTWSVIGNGASIDRNGVLTAATVSVDSIVTVTASYTENGVTKTANFSVTVKALTATLTDLSVSCPATVTVGSTATCSAMALYSNNTSNAVSVTWSSGDSSVLSVNGGSLSAGNVTTDTPVRLYASYTENGVTKMATALVTVKGASASLNSLAIGGGTAILSGQSASLTATALYADGTSRNVTGNVTWNLVGTGAAIDAAGTITAQTVTADTSVTVTATYSENGVSKSATMVVTIKLSAATLRSMEVNCPTDMTAGSAGICSAQAVYSDGKRTLITNGTWSVTPSRAASIDSSGKVTALAVTTDTPITVTASYTENGTTLTAAKIITIKTAACQANTSEISVNGDPAKRFGDALDVRYRLCNFNKTVVFDLYIAVQLPDNILVFAQSAGTLFGDPALTTFTSQIRPYLTNILLPDVSGSIFYLNALPTALPAGTYTFYAVPVLAGGNVANTSEWVGVPAIREFTLMK